MTLTQQIITIALCVLGTQLTRFVPFLIFNEHRKTPAFVQYLGKVLPGAIFDAGRLLPEIRLLPPLRRGLFFYYIKYPLVLPLKIVHSCVMIIVHKFVFFPPVRR